MEPYHTEGHYCQTCLPESSKFQATLLASRFRAVIRPIPTPLKTVCVMQIRHRLDSGCRVLDHKTCLAQSLPHAPCSDQLHFQDMVPYSTLMLFSLVYGGVYGRLLDA